MTGPLTCPVCAERLRRSAGGYDCSRGHRYDLNRHGYVNLLPHGHGRSGRTGDTADMIAARGRFLDAGHYQPLRAALARRVVEAVAGDAGVLDAGCGDGYYLAGVLDALRAGDIGDAGAMTALGFGCDISPAALRAAGRRCRNSVLFLNDVTHGISMAAGSVDVLLNVFAPRNAAEFARVVRPGGLLLVVVPAREHLAELADVLAIGAAPEKQAGVVALLGESFELEDTEHVEYVMDLSGDDVAHLVGMTPSAWHMEVPAAPGARWVTASFDVLAFRRHYWV